MAISEVLRAHDRTQGWLAEQLDMGESTLSQKLTGQRRWTVEEANRVLSVLRTLDETLDLDRLFGDTPPSEAVA
jgi:hypothetical protein